MPASGRSWPVVPLGVTQTVNLRTTWVGAPIAYPCRMDAHPGRAVTRSQQVFDAALAGIVAAVGVAEAWIPLGSASGEGSRVASIVLVLSLAATLAWRRRYPTLVAATVIALSLLAYIFAPVYLQFWGGMAPIFLAVYTVARSERSVVAVATATVATGVLLVPLTRPQFSGDDVAFLWLNAVGALALGMALRRAEGTARQAALRALVAEEAAERATEDARRAERLRIAREMHDVVAHSVSVMVVQASGAESALDVDPEYTRAALGRIRDVGGDALSDMQRVLSVLRDDGDEHIGASQPGVAALADLVADAQAAGLRATLRHEGAPRALPPGLDLTVFRIVQEALTNVRRHAHATSATVLLRYGVAGLTVEVADDGRGVLVHPVPEGHGVAGMRERAALFGGTVEISGEAGFTVRALLPWGMA